KLLT
ncbi:3-oxoacyl-[acyl-carrier-protein] reductase FabG, partial [Chlamydia psittaci C1/97]